MANGIGCGARDSRDSNEGRLQIAPRVHAAMRPAGSVTLLALLVVAAVVVPPVHAQAVTDSVRIEREAFLGLVIEDDLWKCWWGVYGIWPDTKAQVLEVDSTSYADYQLIDANGEALPQSWGQTYTQPNWDVTVPKGYFGYLRSLGGSGSRPGFSPNCFTAYASFRAWVAVQPEWYAVYSLDDGVPIAEFEWDQKRGLNVDFDGSFPDHSRETEDPKKPVASYEWDFGDESQPASGATPSHEYDEPGQYFVTLKVTDDDGQEATLTREVRVRGVVLEHRLFTGQRNVATGDTLVTTIEVKNVGTETASEVIVARGLSAIATFPESDDASSTDAEWETLSVLEDTTFTDVGPDEVITVTERFLITKGAEATVESETVPVPVDWEMLVARVAGYDEDGLPAEINDLCAEGSACANDNKTRVSNKPMDVDLEVTALNAIVAQAPSGLSRKADNGDYDHLTSISLDDPVCNSGCVDLSFRVTDRDGAPVEDAIIELTQELDDPDGEAIVTPTGARGVFCDDTGCGTTLNLQGTDSDGRQTARYWLPGVIDDVDAKIIARATKTEYNVVESEKMVEVKASRVGFVNRSVRASPEEMIMLTASGLKQEFVQLTDMANWCLEIEDVLPDAAAVLNAPAFSATRHALENAVRYTCSRLFSLPDYADPAVAPQVTVQEYNALREGFNHAVRVYGLHWFEINFGVSPIGTGKPTVSDAPPFFDADGDYLDAVAEAVDEMLYHYRGNLSSTDRPPAVTLELYEVSHKDESGVENPALFFSFETPGNQAPKADVQRLLTDGYVPDPFLKQEPVATSISLAASRGDESITLAASANATHAPAKTAHAYGATRSASAALDAFQVGHIVAVEPNTGREEYVQITTITDSTWQLTTPLKFAHTAGKAVFYVDSAAVGVPAAPIRTGGFEAMFGLPTKPRVEWRPVDPSSEFTVEVATDSLFSDVIQTHTEITTTQQLLDTVDDGMRYYWRVSAHNLLGQGPWSPAYALQVGTPVGDDLADAITLADEEATVLLAAHFGATAETSEVVPTCGEGDNSIWFTYTAGTGRRVALETFRSNFNTTLSVWTGSGHPLTEVACSDDYEGGFGTSYVEFDAAAATTYSIRVAGFEDEEGLTVLSLRTPTQVGTEEVPTTQVSELTVSVYPNPATQEATFEVVQPSNGRLSVSVFDVLGRRQQVVSDDDRSAGTYAFRVDARGLAPGVYFARVAADADVVSRMFVVTR